MSTEKLADLEGNGRFDLQEMLKEIRETPVEQVEKSISQSDIASLLKKKKNEGTTGA